MLYTIYRYPDWYELLYDNGTFTCECNLLDNRMYDDRIVKLHKGVDNEIKFRVFDSDRKRTRIDHLRVDVTLINKENHEIGFKTKADLMPQRGTFRVHFREGDLINLSPGYYDMVITGEEYAIAEQPGSIVATPFYSDLSANMQMTVLITQQGEKLPVPTLEVHSYNPKTKVSDWMSSNEIIDGIYTRVYRSSPFPAGRLKNYKNATHTFAITCDKFMGRFAVKGTLEHVPPTETAKYFPLNLTTFKEHIQYGPVDPVTNLYTPFTGIDPFTFEANCLWIIFEWIPTDSRGVPIDENMLPIPYIEPITRLQYRS